MDAQLLLLLAVVMIRRTSVETSQVGRQLARLPKVLRDGEHAVRMISYLNSV